MGGWCYVGWIGGLVPSWVDEVVGGWVGMDGWMGRYVDMWLVQVG